MITKEMIIEKARLCGFDDIGFTTADPFEEHRELLMSRREEYGWAERVGLDLANGTDPGKILPGARSIIVLIDVYFRRSFPVSLQGHFGRCYLDDDRVTRDGLSLRVKEFRAFLRDHGIASQVPFHMPHRVAAARAGLGTFGKNCLFYSSRSARRSSWITPLPIVIDRVFEPDTPTLGMGCPVWCRNACISACPTRALKGNGTIDPRRCISYLTYFGEDITPVELREAMGLYVYGCDRCQNVCPRNQPWLAQELPPNEKVLAMEGDFALPRLLHMDRDYFEKRIWPHMFYMTYSDVWRWKMNAARAMGNTLDERYISDLKRAFEENTDNRVRRMAAWALGALGGEEARHALEDFAGNADSPVREEVLSALEACRRA